MKRACIATIEIQTVIVVDDADPKWKQKAQKKAQKKALETLKDDCFDFADSDFAIGPMTLIPAAYGDDFRVHTVDGITETFTALEASQLPGGYAHVPEGAKP